jgi:hypothetical protein
MNRNMKRGPGYWIIVERADLHGWTNAVRASISGNVC